ncbi:ATP-binding protein [Rhodoferax antarcticus]|uniref:histidine kinase n=1 Tax=Rhodoferax antarcticus ANT.BR TaxID=1111071 RepID=A0A1Q8YGM6_9BURK|nr:ATP-binding protein [Rhodoferax antarcticus]APW45558.1 two-component sensor histidine kinase [Rhodoferax antarcticus]OLP07040.1 Periplasmic sensor signal transduction histidine kinase with HAMP domain [Rhodoferax antarcticus ANT.BR]
MILFNRLESLQARLLALLLTMICGVWISAAALTWIDTRHEIDELLDAHLAQSAALLVAQQTDTDEAKRDDKPYRLHTYDDRHPDAPTLHKYATRVAFQVFHDGKLTLHSGTAPETPMSPQVRGFATVDLPDGGAWRVFGAQGNEGDVQVFVGEQLRSRQSILWAVMQAVLMPLLVTLPILAVLGWLAVRQSLAPLRTLSEALARRQPQAVVPLVIDDTPTEMVPVVQSLNTLLARIGQMMETERRFTADAAHELRTPIAAVRAQAQVAQGAGDDVDQRDQALRHTLEGCDRASHLVAQLLTLSRLETAGNTTPGVRVDACQIARRVAADLAPGALARSQVLTLDCDAPSLIAADELLTGVLIRNLLDNALRYSPDGAQVTVALTCKGGLVKLQIDDSGPGVPSADLARLGERFYRGLGTAQSGSGLGWSIVRRIADVYRAQVAAGPSSLGGLCVTVTWPIAPDQGSRQI